MSTRLQRPPPQRIRNWRLWLVVPSWLLAGCLHSNNKLIGTWVQAPDPLFSNPPNVKLTFEGNGTFKAKVAFPEGSIVQSGTYTTDDKSVVFQCKSYDMTASDPVTQMRLSKEEDQAMKLLRDPVHRTLTWISPTQFKMPGMLGVLEFGDTYNRK